MKKLILLVFILITNLTFATTQALPLKTQIGITDLITNNIHISDNQESQQLGINIESINTQIINQIKSQLPTINPQLVTSLYQNKDLYLYNGNVLFNQWMKSNPKILNTLQTQEVEEMVAVAEANKKIKNPYPKKTYLLIGSVSKINVNQRIKNIPNSNIKSITYTTEVWINYNLVEVNSKKTIARFIVLGRDGDAFLATDNTVPNTKYDVDKISKACISQILTYTRAGILRHIKF